MGLPGLKDLPDRALLALLVAGPADLVRDLVAVLADDLVADSAHLAAVGLVGGQDAIVAVDDDESLVHGVEDAPDEFLALPDLFLGLLALGDVLPGPAQDVLRAGLIVPELRLRVKDPGCAVPQDEPVVDAERFSGLHGLVDALFQNGPVIGMDHFEEHLEVSRVLFGVEPEQAEQFVGPDYLAGRQIVLPAPDVRDALRLGKLLFPLAQRGIGLLALGDIAEDPDQGQLSSHVHGGRIDVGINDGSVLPQHRDVRRQGDLAAHLLFKEVQDPGQVLFRMHVFDTQVDELVAGVAEHIAHGPVRFGVLLLQRIGDHDPVYHVLEYGAELVFRLRDPGLGRFLRGDVPDDAEQGHGFSLAVAGDFAEGMRVALPARQVDHPVFAFKGLAVFHRIFHGVHEPVAAFGRQGPHEHIEGRLILPGVETIDPVYLVGPEDLVREYVPLPIAEFGDLLGFLKVELRSSRALLRPACARRWYE